MLSLLPDDDTLYDALLSRDATFDGRAFVCVATTGIFCRLTCPARNPKRENCSFHETAAACVAAGYRPCKRCRPLSAADPLVTDLLMQLDAEPGRRWSEADLVRLGLDPSTVRRVFRRSLGTTFLDLARQRRVTAGIETMGAGGRVIDAQIEAGFDSPSAFRDAFARLLGVAPGSLKRNARLRASALATPLGPMICLTDASHLYLLEFVGRAALPAELASLHRDARGDLGPGRTPVTDRVETTLDDFFTGRDARLDLPLAPGGTPFERQVWAALQEIPVGRTLSYGALATRIGRPTAVRAVARANGRNRIALVIPCHRVIGADGSLTGYGGGLWRKERLLEIERRYEGTTT